MDLDVHTTRQTDECATRSTPGVRTPRGALFGVAYSQDCATVAHVVRYSYFHECATRSALAIWRVDLHRQIYTPDLKHRLVRYARSALVRYASHARSHILGIRDSNIEYVFITRPGTAALASL